MVAVLKNNTSVKCISIIEKKRKSNRIHIILVLRNYIASMLKIKRGD